MILERAPAPAPPVVWDRERSPRPVPGPASRAPACLWSAGFLSNRRRFASRLPAPAEGDDGDLVAALWAELGERCLPLLEGPFAFVLWDPRWECLVAVCDRLGQHRLVHAENRGRVAVGTSAPAVLAAVGLEPRPDPLSALAHLCSAPPPPGASFYAGARVVEGGSWLRVSRRAVDARRWWRVEDGGETGRQRDRHPDAAARVRRTLDRVVDEVVPPRATGILLSGGLDSTSVAAALVATRGATPAPPPRCYTWEFPALPAADECAAASRVAARLGLPHRRLRADHLWPLSAAGGVRPGPEGPFVLAYRELLDATFAALRADGVDCVVSGAGGDLLFGYCGPGMYGYPSLLLEGRWRELLRQLREHRARSAAPLATLLDRELLRPLLRPLVRRVRGADPRTPPWIAPCWRDAAAELVRPRPVRAATPARRYRLRALDFRFQSQVLQEMRRIASAAGLDVAFPLVDHRLWELAASLPPEACFRAGVHKAALREAVRHRLPAAVVDSRSRPHLAPLFHRGLREREAEKVAALLTGMRAAELGLVDEVALRRSYEGYRQGGDDSRFWQAVTLEAWLRALP